MSIIYEALKKVEREQVAVLSVATKTNEPDIIAEKAPSKNTKFLTFLLIALLTAVFLLIAPRYLTQSSSPVKFKKNVFAKRQEVFERKAIPEKQISILEPKTELLGEIAQGTYILQGIVYDEQLPSAIINGKTLKKFEKIDDFEVREITPTTVKLLNLNDNTELTLSF